MMKKISVFILALLTFTLVSCSGYNKTDYCIGDYKVYYEDKGSCEMLIYETFYLDDEYVYTFRYSGCGGGAYYYIQVDDEYVDVETAIEEEIITFEQVLDSGIDIYRKSIEDDNSTFEKI